MSAWFWSDEFPSPNRDLTILASMAIGTRGGHRSHMPNYVPRVDNRGTRLGIHL